MAGEQNTGEHSKIDARVVSLCSREVQTLPPFKPHGAEMFTYYDLICVDKVDVDNRPPLAAAYGHAVEMNKQIPKDSPEFRQAHLVFTDIRTTDSRKKYGYTEEEIESFWNNSEKDPIFFMTMLHLGRKVKFQTAIDRIKAIMRDRRHLIYFSFDYSDLILFFRGNCFKEYAKLIFQVDYHRQSPIVVDSITLYSFVWQYCNTEEESFIAHYRIGVTDYNYAKRSIKAIQKAHPNTIATWSLGRQDVGLFCGEATLLWIKDVYNVITKKKRSSQKMIHWCTTRDLSILIPVPQKSAIAGHTESVIEITTARIVLGEKVNSFTKAYENCCDRLRVKADSVWLNWLADSCFLAATFFDNKMSFNMGVCLVPQFMDMFEYMTALFEQNCFDIGNMKQARSGMSSFFSNILTLIDSMNHSNRQSVQAPSFHMMAFDMPPQIMAFYTAVARLLINVFCDDKHFYGFTISPQFTQELTVKSLALQDVMPGDQFISINIGERSLYNLQMTTEVMVHEISHFVGEQNRCREIRKEYMLKCALHRLISFISNDVVKRIYGDSLPLLKISVLDKYAAVEELYKKLIAYEPDYNPDVNVYTAQVEEDIVALPRRLLSNPGLSNSFFDVVCRRILPTTADEQAQESLIKLAEAMDIGIPSAQMIKLSGEGDEYCQSAYWREVERIVRVQMQELCCAELRRRVKSGKPVLAEEDEELSMRPQYLELTLAAQLRHLFQETFADLQTTLLLNLSWKAYYNYLRPADNADSDICVRVLAMVHTLAETRVWDVNDIKDFLSDVNNKPIPKVKDLADLHPLFSANDYSDKNVDPIYVYYMTKYLSACKHQIDKSFAEAQNKEDSYRYLSRIRKVHAALSDGVSVLQMQEAVTELISDYKGYTETRLSMTN